MATLEELTLLSDSPLGADHNSSTSDEYDDDGSNPPGTKDKLLGGTNSPRRAASVTWSPYHVVVFALTFMSFMLIHASRKAFSNVKSLLEQEWTAIGDCQTGRSNDSLYCQIGPTDVWRRPVLFASSGDAELFMGSLDTVFMFFYAAGLYISGALGDRLPAVWVLSAGMCASSAATFAFGCLTQWAGVQRWWLYISLWAINGLAQSACWPCIVAIMAGWFGKTGRGFVFGLWSASGSAGNIVGALVVAAVLEFGYDAAFLVVAAMVLAGCVINVFCLAESPAMPDGVHVGGPVRKTSWWHELEVDRRELDTDVGAEPEPQLQAVAGVDEAIGFFAAWRIPGVLEYSLAYACLKVVNYSLFFWLPFYLTDSLHWSRTVASKLSTLFDLGAVVGGTLSGIASDWLGRASPVFAVMLLIATPFLFIYRQFGTGVVSNSVLMFMIGFWIGGPANLISGAISVGLGQHEKLKGNTKAMSTVAGIVDGTGSVGAAVGQYLIGLIETRSGWQNVIYFLMAMLIMAIVCTGRMVFNDCCELRQKYKTRNRGL